MATPINQVPFSPIPKNATKEQIDALLKDHINRFIAANPAYFHPDGTQKTMFERLASLWL